MNAALTAKLEMDIRLTRACLRHWDRILHCVPREVPSWPQCALCDTYIHNHCRSCPIAIDAGKTYCEGTPYEQASDFWWLMDGAEFDEKPDETLPVPFEFYARAEIAYLTRILHNLEDMLKEESNHE